MNAVEKGVEALKDEIRHEIRGIFKMNMKFEGWSVPESNSNQAANEIRNIMQKALDELKDEIKIGKYDNN